MWVEIHFSLPAFTPFNLMIINMKKEFKVMVMTCIAIWLFAPKESIGQHDSIASYNLDEVVITATKFPKKLRDVGKVLVIIDKEELEHSKGKDLSQLLNEQTGLIINGANSNFAKDKSVYLQGATSASTLILIDGIPVVDPSGVGGIFDLRSLSLDQVERIEILKGSQSTLYGSDAVAGVINIITINPTEKSLEGGGTLSYGSFDTFRGNANVAGLKGIFDYNLDLTYERSGGFSEAMDTTASQAFDLDGSDKLGAQLLLGIKPNSKLTIDPFVRFSRFEGDYDAGAFTDDTTAVYNIDFLNYGFYARYNLAKGAIHAQYGHNLADRSFQSGFGNFDFYGIFDHLETYLSYDLSDRVQVLGGLSYQNWSLGEDLDSISLGITSPYASFLFNSGGFHGEAGVRYVHHSTYGSTWTYSFNPSYLIGSKLKLFFNLSSGFKAPTLNQLYGQFGANEDLKPEISVSADGGLHYFSPSGLFDSRITMFNRRVIDVIIYTGMYENVDEQNTQGIELEGSFQVDPSLKIKGFYAFVVGETTTQIGDQDSTFQSLFRRPKHSGGLNLSYRINRHWYARAGFQYFGERDDIYFNLQTFSSDIVSLKPYLLLNLYTSYSVQDDQITFFIDLKNLLNENYFEVYGYTTQKMNFTGGVTLRL